MLRWIIIKTVGFESVQFSW